ncbi:MAG: 1-acyl-sn-glycerol-3-phosphate acyltransferase [Brevundimonas sp.]|uniref:1-acyl-sn-glycerol-3-phosphate acyltransferase n=1 Tax=Brevundimonas sp. TaxID=1871086 RepID=UPI00403497FF
MDPAPATLPIRSEPHIVDVLIAERAPRLTRSAAWPLVRPPLYGLLHYSAARRMADAVRDLSGRQGFDHLSDLLKLKVTVDHAERIPATGRCVVVCNHPTGIADGIAMYDAINDRRRDAIFFANADALRVSPRLDEIIIPVEWVLEKRTREKTRRTLDAARAAFEGERCLVMFPAGRLARVEKGLLTDPDWAATAASMARKYGAPVIPIHMTGPTSTLFHLFDRVSRELRDITLFHELLNKAGKPFHLIVGKPIPPEALHVDAVKATATLKTFVERTLPADPDAVFG